jgi:hypothetical protein
MPVLPSVTEITLENWRILKMSKALANPKLFAATGILFVAATLVSAYAGSTDYVSPTLVAAPKTATVTTIATFTPAPDPNSGPCPFCRK